MSTHLTANLKTLLEVFHCQPYAHGAWWWGSAIECLQKNRYQLITGRNNRKLYLARFWLSVPRASRSESRCPHESGNSLLLHYFAQSDDDKALHDHPWDFTSTVLSGGYHERRPAKLNVLIGPTFAECLLEPRLVGTTVERKSTDLHAVEQVQPNTWTLVRTRTRTREWGFHPPRRKWVPWREYLEGKKPTKASKES